MAFMMGGGENSTFSQVCLEDTGIELSHWELEQKELIYLQYKTMY